MRPIIIHFFSAFLVIVSSGLASGTDAEGCRPFKPYYQDKMRGWYYGEVCDDEPEEKEKQPEQEKVETGKYRSLSGERVEIPWDLLDRLDPDEIQKIEKEARKISVMIPTEENVREHKRLLAWIGEKTIAFMRVNQKLARTDAEFAAKIAETPVSTWGREAVARTRLETGEQLLKEYSERVGLVMFEEKGCPYCREQKPILDLFSRDYHWDVRHIDIGNIEPPPSPTWGAPSGEALLIQKLGIRAVPDLFLVLNKNGKAVWQRIGIGLHTYDEIKRSILYGLYLLGEIQDERLGP